MKLIVFNIPPNTALKHVLKSVCYLKMGFMMVSHSNVNYLGRQNLLLEMSGKKNSKRARRECGKKADASTSAHKNYKRNIDEATTSVEKINKKIKAEASTSARKKCKMKTDEASASAPKNNKRNKDEAFSAGPFLAQDINLCIPDNMQKFWFPLLRKIHQNELMPMFLEKLLLAQEKCSNRICQKTAIAWAQQIFMGAASKRKEGAAVTTFVKLLEPSCYDSACDEVEINLNDLKQSTLRELQKYVENFKKETHTDDDTTSSSSSSSGSFLFYSDDSKSSNDNSKNGLDHICEIVRINQPPVYQCFLCSASLTTSKLLIEHITGLKHQMAFLKEHDKEKFRLIEKTGLTKIYIQPILKDLMTKYEEEHGRGRMSVKKEKGKPGKKNSTAIDQSLVMSKTRPVSAHPDSTTSPVNGEPILTGPNPPFRFPNLLKEFNSSIPVPSTSGSVSQPNNTRASYVTPTESTSRECMVNSYHVDRLVHLYKGRWQLLTLSTVTMRRLRA